MSAGWPSRSRPRPGRSAAREPTRDRRVTPHGWARTGASACRGTSGPLGWPGRSPEPGWGRPGSPGRTARRRRSAWSWPTNSRSTAGTWPARPGSPTPASPTCWRPRVSSWRCSPARTRRAARRCRLARRRCCFPRRRCWTGWSPSPAVTPAGPGPDRLATALRAAEGAPSFEPRPYPGQLGQRTRRIPVTSREPPLGAWRHAPGPPKSAGLGVAPALPARGVRVDGVVDVLGETRLDVVVGRSEPGIGHVGVGQPAVHLKVAVVEPARDVLAVRLGQVHRHLPGGRLAGPDGPGEPVDAGVGLGLDGEPVVLGVGGAAPL